MDQNTKTQAVSLTMLIFRLNFSDGLAGSWLAWIMQLVLVVAVFILMILRSVQLKREQYRAPLVEVIMRDGLTYFR
jgi:ABC-type phosphate transport system permease subunit